MTTRSSDFGPNKVFSAFFYLLLIITIFIAKKALRSDPMTNQAKFNKNNEDFLNFVADLLGSRGFKISDNFFQSLNSSKLAHISSLHLMII